MNGYLNVLRAALPIMAAAGRGRVLGVTSGSGWRPADAGAYSCAKRAVAALTWQLGKVGPPGVTVNALSPIAVTRMVTQGLRQAAPAAGDQAHQTGGLSLALAAMPQPEQLGPVGAYLASDAFAWSSGNVIFSNGSEAARIAPPRLLEVARTTDVARARARARHRGALGVRARRGRQESNGASIGRFASVFAEVDRRAEPRTRCPHVPRDRPTTGAGSRAAPNALPRRGSRASPWTVRRRRTSWVRPSNWPGRRRGGRLDAVVVARAGAGRRWIGTGDAGAWERVLDEHAGITDAIRSDVAWVRAVTDPRGDRRPAGPDRDRHRRNHRRRPEPGPGRGAARPRRAPASPTGCDAFAISVESARRAALGRGRARGLPRGRRRAPPTLSGGELMVGDDWVGLRSHPAPAGIVSFGGPELPRWLDGALRRMVSGATRSDRGGAMAHRSNDRRRPRPPLGSGARRLVPVPGRTAELDMGDISGMCRRFDQATYLSESADWNVEKFVHVAAATGAHSVEETPSSRRWARRPATPTRSSAASRRATRAETERLLDDQMASQRFRGIRPMGGDARRPDADVLRALAGARPGVRAHGASRPARDAAASLADWGDLTVVVEHTGWPRRRLPDEFALWKRGMSALAAWATTSTASSRAWPCRCSRWRPRCSGRGSSIASSRSASTGACSPATSRSTGCTGRSTTSTRRSTAHRGARRRRPRRALRQQRRARLRR